MSNCTIKQLKTSKEISQDDLLLIESTGLQPSRGIDTECETVSYNIPFGDFEGACYQITSMEYGENNVTAQRLQEIINNYNRCCNIFEDEILKIVKVLEDKGISIYNNGNIDDLAKAVLDAISEMHGQN